jgi:hypothetical protein
LSSSSAIAEEDIARGELSPPTPTSTPVPADKEDVVEADNNGAMAAVVIHAGYNRR